MARPGALVGQSDELLGELHLLGRGLALLRIEVVAHEGLRLVQLLRLNHLGALNWHSSGASRILRRLDKAATPVGQVKEVFERGVVGEDNLALNWLHLLVTGVPVQTAVHLAWREG